jgi:acyl-CoA thioester hydrolase
MARFYEQVMGVYFDDLDSFGILHNARYLLLFERTLGSFWQHLGMGGLQSDPDQHHLVRANTIEYLSAVESVGQVRVRLWIKHLGRTSMVIGFRLMPLNEDTNHATGSRAVVRVHPEHRQPTAWTDDFRRRLEPWLVEEGVVP